LPSKLIKEFRNCVVRSSVRYALEYLWALLTSTLLIIGNSLPSGRARRAISTLVTIIAIVVIIGFGFIIIVLLIILPTGPTTTIITTYP